MDRNAGREIRKLPWGTVKGKNVFLYEISCPGGICVRVSDYGGIVQSFVIPSSRDIVLGYDTPEEYARSETFFGAFVGPLADRTGGAKLTLGGREIHLEANAGKDCMHSGTAGFHCRVWDAEILPDGVRFSSAFTDAPLPGTLSVSVTYTVPAPDTLRITYDAICTEETALSFTNHSYFNLGSETCLNDRLTLYASQYAETDCSKDPLVTGVLRDVAGTPFDFRTGARIADAVAAKDFPEIAAAGGVDNYFRTDGDGFRLHARLLSADGTLALLCRSDAPGVLVYTGNGLETEKGKNGEIYEKHGGIAFETESFPNAVNIPEHRPSAVLRAGQGYKSVTEFAVTAVRNP